MCVMEIYDKIVQRRMQNKCYFVCYTFSLLHYKVNTKSDKFFFILIGVKISTILCPRATPLKTFCGHDFNAVDSTSIVSLLSCILYAIPAQVASFIILHDLCRRVCYFLTDCTMRVLFLLFSAFVTIT